MSATSKMISLTETATGDVVMFSSNNLIYVIAEDSGSKIYYFNDGAAMKIKIVDESPATIAAAADVLIPLTDPTLLSITYVNADRILDATTGATISLTTAFRASTVDSTATPVSITQTAHGLTAGMIVTIAGVTGTGAASVNGTYVIGVTNANVYTLIGTTGIALSTVTLTVATETYDLSSVYYNHSGSDANLITARESKTQIQTLVNAIAV